MHDKKHVSRHDSLNCQIQEGVLFYKKFLALHAFTKRDHYVEVIGVGEWTVNLQADALADGSVTSVAYHVVPMLPALSTRRGSMQRLTVKLTSSFIVTDWWTVKKKKGNRKEKDRTQERKHPTLQSDVVYTPSSPSIGRPQHHLLGTESLDEFRLGNVLVILLFKPEGRIKSTSLRDNRQSRLSTFASRFVETSKMGRWLFIDRPFRRRFHFCSRRVRTTKIVLNECGTSLNDEGSITEISTRINGKIRQMTASQKLLFVEILTSYSAILFILIARVNLIEFKVFQGLVSLSYEFTSHNSVGRLW